MYPRGGNDGDSFVLDSSAWTEPSVAPPSLVSGNDSEIAVEDDPGIYVTSSVQTARRCHRRRLVYYVK